MDKTPIFVLYSIVAITIASSLPTLYAQQTIEEKTMENINNVTKNMGQSMADRSTNVVGNFTTAMGESMAQNASSVVEDISQAAVNRTGADVSNQTESLVNQATSLAGNKTHSSAADNSTSSNSTIT